MRDFRNRRERAVRQAQSSKLLERRGKRRLADDQELRHHQAVELIEQHLQAVAALVDAVEALARRDVGAREHDLLARLIDERDVVVLRRLQRRLRQDRARRHDLDNLALCQPLRLRVADLLGDGHLVAALDELVDVRLSRMVRHAAHRRILPLAAARQRQAELLRDELGIFKEHLIKIAEAEEQDCSRILLLRREILLHHRRHFHRYYTSWIKDVLTRCQHACHFSLFFMIRVRP